MADGSQTQTLFIVESQMGVLPTTPTMKVLPVESNTLKMDRGTITDNTLRGDRMGGDVRPGMMTVDGDIKFSHRMTDFDDVLAALFMGSWSTHVLKAANTMQSLAMERGHLDIDQYYQFLGLVPASFDLSLKVGDLVRCSMTFMGIEMTELDGASASSVITDYTAEPFDTFTGSLKEGGVDCAIVTSLDLKITNNLNPRNVLFKDKRDSISAGNFMASGSATMQFNDATYFNKFYNRTSSKLEFDLIDPVSLTKKQTWSIPKIVYTSGDISVPDDKELIVKLDFNAQYDSVSGTKAMITRVVA